MTKRAIIRQGFIPRVYAEIMSCSTSLVPAGRGGNHGGWGCWGWVGFSPRTCSCVSNKWSELRN